MVRRVLLLGVSAAFIISLSGCSTTRKSKDLEVQGLRNQVSALESQVPAKDEGLDSSKQTSLKESETSGEVANKTGETKQPDAKQIQTALKNAGYYNGVVDGKMGKKSRQAVRNFQRANNLTADGRVGKKTWALLKDYLEKKVK